MNSFVLKLFRFVRSTGAGTNLLTGANDCQNDAIYTLEQWDFGEPATPKIASGTFTGSQGSTNCGVQ